MNKNSTIYLDYNATTPIDPQVADSMLPYLYENFGNPSSIHRFGITAKTAVTKARIQTAEMLGCKIDEIIFTSGGSESNNFAIKGVAYSYREKGNHIITSSIEHPAVLEVCKYLENQGYRITYLPVDEFGQIDPADVEKSISSETILITIMHANNEVGTIEPIVDISRIAKKKNILFHSDAAQSIGKIEVIVNKLGVDLLTIAGHKFYAPKGIGALYVRSGVNLTKLIHGADHEMNNRAGTENVIQIVGLGKASELVSNNLSSYSGKMERKRNRFEEQLLSRLDFIKINGHPSNRLPNTSSISFRDLEADLILSGIPEIAASAGAACHSENIEISPTLKAMKVSPEFAMGTIRFSLGRTTTDEDIDSAINRIVDAVEKITKKETKASAKSSAGNIMLTELTSGLGCACKMSPGILQEILKSIPASSDKNILVGTNTSDDASVYQIGPNTAIVQSVDFFTPIVNDPFNFGEIAAANSISDIYAMGAKPLFALSILGYPANRIPLEIMNKIIEGAVSKCREAGITITGGHTIDDNEPKFGLAVTGIVNPASVIKNSTANSGDNLILTKAIGTGIMATALKRGLLSEKDEILLINSMTELNKAASDEMIKSGVNACTDITGFGLLGHLLEMMHASKKSAEIYFNKIPQLSNLTELILSGAAPGGTKNNYEFTYNSVWYDENISETEKLILNDAQTSGGLLISVSEAKTEKLLSRLKKRNLLNSNIIGKVLDKEVKSVKIISSTIKE